MNNVLVALDVAATTTRRDKTMIVVFIGLLILIGMGVVLYKVFPAKDGGGDGDVAGQAAVNKFKESLYQFQGLYVPRTSHTEEVNACASKQSSVVCSDDTCSNCICPDVCRNLGKAYMMLDQQADNAFRCKCADTLDELVVPGTMIGEEDYPELTAMTEKGDVWKKVNRWKGRMLPLDDDQSEAFKYGTGGLYPPGHAYWTEDALNRVVMGSPVDGLAAVYHRPAPFDGILDSPREDGISLS